MTPVATAPSLPAKPPVSSKAYRLASREHRPDSTVVMVGNVPIGGKLIVTIAGPCAVEGEDQIIEAALAARAAGAHILRGGAYKPRTSPYDFQGLGADGLRMLAQAGRIAGLPVVTEAVDSEDVELVAQHADAIQIGARNMSAFRLLQKAARTGKPILLKRGMQASIREWLLAAEYILAEGNSQVILCERGIRTTDAEFTRNTLDLSAVPVVKAESHLPVIVDPSHGTGRTDLVETMSRGAIAVGADGLIVEMHPRPSQAVCDAKQSIDPAQLGRLVSEARAIARLMGREG